MLRKLAKAVGIKMAKPSTVLAAPSTGSLDSASAASDPKPPGPKKSGWATVGAASTYTAPSTSVSGVAFDLDEDALYVAAERQTEDAEVEVEVWKLSQYSERDDGYNGASSVSLNF